MRAIHIILGTALALALACGGGGSSDLAIEHQYGASVPRDGEGGGVRLTIRNASDSPRTLGLVDPSESFRDAFVIESVEPEPVGRAHHPMVLEDVAAGHDLSKGWLLDVAVPPGGAQQVALHVRYQGPADEQDVTFSVDACFDMDRLPSTEAWEEHGELCGDLILEKVVLE